MYLLIDFGSTYTKIAAIDEEREEFLGRSQAPTTVEAGIEKGLRNALDCLLINGKRIDSKTFGKSKKLASSSAAGGLGVVVVGLVPDLTLEAARKAALGAGAKIIGSYSHELDSERVREIEKIGCDILLLVGGTDGGNKNVILHNAKALSDSKLDIPFIVAGNNAVSGKAAGILTSAGKYTIKVDNVLPELDQLNVDPVRSCIREVFMERIVRAKGLDKAQEYIGEIVMPTPMATLKAACLLADGCEGEDGIGELMVVEVGGATTNIHSVAKGDSGAVAVMMKGLPEPYAKRTVEGDLGIRYNAATILEMMGPKIILSYLSPECGVTEPELKDYVRSLRGNVDAVPGNKAETEMDIGLASCAVSVAVERHTGTIRSAWGLTGEILIQEGKDLTRLKTVIGTGGIFAHNTYPDRILGATLFSDKNPFSLKPMAPELLIDKSYLLYGIGLLSDVEPRTALRIAKKHLNKMPQSPAIRHGDSRSKLNQRIHGGERYDK
jgi:uncharacterized protein (TIGR01319 family)